jgi:translation initiation factor 3 subunit H
LLFFSGLTWRCPIAQVWYEEKLGIIIILWSFACVCINKELYTELLVLLYRLKTKTQMEDSGELNEVQLDGVVVLKIIKHCKDNLNEVVTGIIMGLDFDSTLEVTNCFPLPKLADEEDEAAESNEGEEYQWEMMKCLREVNVDNNAVGWYTSTHMSDFLNAGTIDTQFNYQDKIKKSVALVYDPLKTSQGSLSLRAFRLTVHFMNLYKEGTFTKDRYAWHSVSVY